MTQNQSENNNYNALPFEQLKNEAGLIQLFKLFEQKLSYNVINCVRVGIVEEYDPLTRVAKIKIANKLVTGQNKDGTQKTQDYAPIYSKVWFFGWGDKGITHPILQGQEGILLFNDRELESWHINGGVNPLSYYRSHNLSDSIFICGLSSLPNIIENSQNSLNLFYQTNNIQITENGVIINADTTINGNLTVNGQINATGDIIANGISLLNHIHGNGNDGQDTTAPKG